jgi:hypothetical protein
LLEVGAVRVGSRIDSEISFLGRQQPVYEVTGF